MDEAGKEELVARFREYLDRQEVYGAEVRADESDLYSLFTELAGLKSEVRLEARQFKSALDDFRGAFSSLDTANQEMKARFAELGQQNNAELHIKPVILGLLDIHDRLADALAGEDEAATGLPIFCRRLARRYRSHVAGLKMVLDRVRELLALCGVTPIETRERVFDPRMMKAVGFSSTTGVAPGTVCDQQRTGFTWNGRLLRPAEVIVAKEEQQ